MGSYGSSWWRYVPWVVIVNFLIMVIGLGIWGAKSMTTLDLSLDSFAALGIEFDTPISEKGRSYIVAVAVVYALLSTYMLGMSFYFGMMRMRDDQRGTADGATTCWALNSGIIIFLWWLFMLLLILLVMAEVLWLVSMFGVSKAAEVGARAIRKATNATNNALVKLSSGLQDSEPLAPPAPPPINGTDFNLINGTTNGTTNGTVFVCPNNCMDLSLFDFLLGESTCVCALDAVTHAADLAEEAVASVKVSCVGVVMVFMSSILMLVCASVHFGETHREIQLIRRADMLERNKLSANGGPSKGKGAKGWVKGMFSTGKKSKSTPNMAGVDEEGVHGYDEEGMMLNPNGLDSSLKGSGPSLVQPSGPSVGMGPKQQSMDRAMEVLRANKPPPEPKAPKNSGADGGSKSDSSSKGSSTMKMAKGVGKNISKAFKKLHF
mmetsp:Transcript_37120/g.82586  ORF Transcript_37120/g.82586 Transcript_37120/m.82586 type:complete len:435 (-) Transcript_37120:1252-2556(-)